MSLTVDLTGNENVTLTDGTVERRPPDRLEVSVDGRLSVTDALLAQFEGATLDPVAVTVSSDDADQVEIDLTGPAALRLQNVDVGVATPDAGEIPGPTDALRSSADGGPDGVDPPPDVLAFTIDGTISDVPPATLEAIGGDDPRLESLTFAVEDSVRSDGGSGNDVVFEFTLLGYGVVVRRDGMIVVGSGEGGASIDLS